MKNKMKYIGFGLILILIIGTAFKKYLGKNIELKQNAHISLVGNNLGSRMINYDYFETELHLRYPTKNLTVRNLCDGGDTPGFRPHSARFSPWAFPGAEKFQKELANNSESEGFFDSHDKWLTNLKTDIVIGFFGFNESFEGPTGISNFKAELQAWVDHTKNQNYNGEAAPEIVLVSPTAYEDLSAKIDVPNGKKENINLQLYTLAIKEIATKNKIKFIDVFSASKAWYQSQTANLTIDGLQLNNDGYKLLGTYLNDEIFGKKAHESKYDTEVYAAVEEKNWMWHNDYKIPNGVHVYGRRFNPFGPDNYPAEIQKIREMTSIRDRSIWQTAISGKGLNLVNEDKATKLLADVKTNYNPKDNGSLKYLSGQEALDSIKMAPGYKMELFASETEFPDLAKPVQMTFDNKGRLWVACMPSYPHYKPGDSKPDDKIIILEDTNNDGKADKQTVFADKLHVPVGFEITHLGVYVSQGTNLVLLKDTNNDDKADVSEVVLSGFDDHDTHHEISAFVADESGAFYMGEGIFLHTNVETPYGPVRATNGGFMRYDPNRRHLERVAQLAIPNPWGIAFDKWGQNFFAETSGPDVRWMMPGTIKPRYGESNPKAQNLIQKDQMVRPTSGLEFMYSRHFPDEVQGDMLINNTIGFLGMKQHQMIDNEVGYSAKFRHDLFKSTDRNFRPVDMEIAPDGSLYVIDWHNILIGHMQHNARDPLRDHTHGRVYRVTYPDRPLVKPASVAGASIEQLLENLKLPEYRSRYRTRRELRGRNVNEVLAKTQAWVAALDKNDTEYEHHLLEGLWVTWGINKVDKMLLKRLLKSQDYKVRSAAVKVLRYVGHQVSEQVQLLQLAAADVNGRVRLEALVAASWLPQAQAMSVINITKKLPKEDWLANTYEAAEAHASGRNSVKPKEVYSTTNIKGKDLELFTAGRILYSKEGNCVTCHQADGNGLEASGFPPLSKNNWVAGSPDRLIKIVLNGIMGPIDVNGKSYPGQVPMTPYGGMMNDKEIASVITYVRNSFGNQASAIYPEQIKKVRLETKSKKDFYSPAELLEKHPLEK